MEAISSVKQRHLREEEASPTVPNTSASVRYEDLAAVAMSSACGMWGTRESSG
jgi:type IV pilus biogenesis protein CpaD/CtpE